MNNFLPGTRFCVPLFYSALLTRTSGRVCRKGDPEFAATAVRSSFAGLPICSQQIIRELDPSAKHIEFGGGRVPAIDGAAERYYAHFVQVERERPIRLSSVAVPVGHKRLLLFGTR